MFGHFSAALSAARCILFRRCPFRSRALIRPVVVRPRYIFMTLVGPFSVTGVSRLMITYTTCKNLRMSPGILTTPDRDSTGSPPKVSSHAFGGLPSVAWSPPPSLLEAECHPLEKYVSDKVDKYLIHWPFKSANERKNFVAARFSRVTCLYFPSCKG